MLREKGEESLKTIEGGRAKEKDEPSQAAVTQPDARLCRYLPHATVSGERTLENSIGELILDTSGGSEWLHRRPAWLTENHVP